MIAAHQFHFAQPLWLLGALVGLPLVWWSWRSMRSLGAVRRALAAGLRVLVVALLAALLARPKLIKINDQVTLIVVVDRSDSVAPELRADALSTVAQAADGGQPDDRLAVVDLAETAAIARLPGTARELPGRNTTLVGAQTDLAAGVHMAMAIAPPDTAVRLLLVSDGNQTEGDLRGAARIAAANGVPIDVLPIRYRHAREVVFRRLDAPTRARAGQTVDLRFILNSTHEAQGELMVTLNGRIVDLDPDSDALAARVKLDAGTNVQTVSLPLVERGVQEFQAVFLPSDPNQDVRTQNNQAGAVTFVSGPGRMLVVDARGQSGDALANALAQSNIDVKRITADQLPDSLVHLADVDAVVLVNTPNNLFTYAQQEMLCLYVTQLGGGLCMIGGPEAFGAGGWIGSPVAEVLPVDLDPPQKKQMPKGALVLIMHACEMPRGNYWGKQVALAAVNSLSRLDLVGVLDYAWQGGSASWVYPLGPVGDRREVTKAIGGMVMGDMPDFQGPMRAGYQALQQAEAGQKHMIIISDGDPSPPTRQLVNQMNQAGITCSGVAVFPHSPADVRTLRAIAQATGGRFYHIQDPTRLPQIFIKEAQVVRRPLIVERTFRPRVLFGLGEILQGLPDLPELDGYVLTGPKGGLTRRLLGSGEGDPILATGQYGLGRCLAFTSSTDARWARSWLGWPGFARFWEQALRWVGKSAYASECELYADVRGREARVTVETVDAEGNFVQMREISAQVIDPEMDVGSLELSQVGPGRYQGHFEAQQTGAHLVAVTYRRAGAEQLGMSQCAVYVPYAPEHSDLSDNEALLRETARITGGRVVKPGPDKPDLFSREGLEFPRAQVPLTRPLLLVWLGLFLLDVAARRIALDVRAAARRVVALLSRRRVTGSEVTLERLRLRRRRVREQLRATQRGERAARKYEPKPGATDATLPTTPVPPAESVSEAPPQAPAKPSGPADREEGETLQRLLRIKRKERDHDRDQREDDSRKETEGR